MYVLVWCVWRGHFCVSRCERMCVFLWVFLCVWYKITCTVIKSKVGSSAFWASKPVAQETYPYFFLTKIFRFLLIPGVLSQKLLQNLNKHLHMASQILIELAKRKDRVPVGSSVCISLSCSLWTLQITPTN